MGSTHVEKVSLEGASNGSLAESDSELRAYFARKRTISARSLLLLTLVAAALALRSPALGVDLLIGGACGVVNMLLLMRGNERLLDGKSRLGAHAAGGLIRIATFGAVPVITAARGPWWAMFVYFAGYFTPLALYALALQRHYRREALATKLRVIIRSGTCRSSGPSTPIRS